MICKIQSNEIARLVPVKFGAGRVSNISLEIISLKDGMKTETPFKALSKSEHMILPVLYEDEF